MVYPIQPSIVVEKSEGAGILKLGRGRSSVGAKKVSWADISGDGCLEMGPSKATSSVKAKQLDRSLESTLVEGQRRPLTIKIKPLQSLSPNKSYDTDVIEGWDSDLTELSESGNESSSDNDVPISSLQVWLQLAAKNYAIHWQLDTDATHSTQYWLENTSSAQDEEPKHP